MPYVRASSLGVTTEAEPYLEALIRWYHNNGYFNDNEADKTIYFAVTEPNFDTFIVGHIYGSSMATTYSNWMHFSIAEAEDLVSFGFNNGTFFYRPYSKRIDRLNAGQRFFRHTCGPNFNSRPYLLIQTQFYEDHKVFHLFNIPYGNAQPINLYVSFAEIISESSAKTAIRFIVHNQSLYLDASKFKLYIDSTNNISSIIIPTTSSYFDVFYAECYSYYSRNYTITSSYITQEEFDAGFGNSIALDYMWSTVYSYNRAYPTVINGTDNGGTSLGLDLVQDNSRIVVYKQSTPVGSIYLQ